MPLLLPVGDTASSARVWRLQGLPDFNTEGDITFAISRFDGFFDAPAPQSALTPNGGGPGAVASGDWLPAEAPYLVVGRVVGDKPLLIEARRLLLAALPTDREVPVVALGSGWDVDLQIFVRRYDKADIAIRRNLEFSIPLVAADPYKYAVDALTGQMGVWTGEDWYTTYTDDGGWVDTYTLDSSQWISTYQQETAAGPYPDSLSLTSPGDAVTRRVTVTVTGPLTAGDWWLWSQIDNRRLWVEAGIGTEQTLTLDCAAETAYLNGADVTYLVHGDWLTLQPGPNVLRLVSGTDTAAYASVTALPAYL